MISLKPCPFCGRDLKHYTARYIGPICTQLEIKCCVEFSIDTENIYYSDTGMINCSTDAIELWNTRAEQPEIIRCKDCKHHGTDYCHNPRLCGNHFLAGDDDFCSWAEQEEKV